MCVCMCVCVCVCACVCVSTCTAPCSDGLGRSCLFVTLWLLTDQLMTEDQVDVVSAFKVVRASRPGAMDSLVRPGAGCVGLPAEAGTRWSWGSDESFLT